MPIRGICSGGQSRSDCTWQWTPEPLSEPERLSAGGLYEFEIDERDFVSFAEYALSEHGWNRILEINRLETLDSYIWGLAPSELRFVARYPREASFSLIQSAEAAGTQRANTAILSKVIDGIFRLAEQNQFGEINAMLKSASPQSLAPEFLVGVPRVTFKWRSRLSEWGEFTRKAIEELTVRGGFNLRALFDGIAKIED